MIPRCNLTPARIEDPVGRWQQLYNARMGDVDDSARAGARVILLGASNLTKSISLIVETARNLLGSPLDVKAAMGHGRSFGWDSFLIVRSLPSILDSGLWRHIEREPPLPSYALITDIGNDVMYGASAEQIAGWVTECVNRLQAMNARIVMTALPLASIERLNERHYLIARSIFFPTKRITFEDAKRCAFSVHEQLAQLAASRGIAFVEQAREWYGIDPIHPRRSVRPRIWRDVLRHWSDCKSQAPLARGSLQRAIALRLATPENWRLLGMKRGRMQPSVRLPDGTLVGYY